MKRIFIIIAAAVLFAACDKIAPEEYTIYSGPVITWEQGDATVAPVQCAFVEKYTGPKCTNCPLADATLDAAHQQFGERLVLISVNHPTGQGEPFSGQPDLRCDDGTAWDNYFGINAIPAAYLNRRTTTLYQGQMSNITSDIATALNESPVVVVSLTADDSDRDGKVDITVNVVFAQSYTQPLTLTLALTEDSLEYKQLMPNGTRQDDYVHNHMLRDVITDVWGADIECTGNAGEARRTSLTYTIPSNDINPDNCNIVAFVSDKQSREILNSNHIRIAR